jgi:cyclopropane fatty-acyl-phospholipid synthase-like methyltransferase
VKPKTTDDILKLMEGYLVSAALGTAMELGLFWLLDREPLAAAAVADSLDIPLNRCHHWLEILCRLGLLGKKAGRYSPTSVAREAILSSQSQETWAFQARENRNSSRFVQDLAVNIGKPMQAWQAWDLTSPGYFQQIQEDPGYAAQFTRKLYEIHRPLAEQLAGMLDLEGVQSLLDLGGGSGVVSFALLRKRQDLTSVVVDIANVCRAGRAIASENQLEERMTYLVADFMQDDLPAGFNMVMLCDVGVFDETLFRKIYEVLDQDGRLVIVDKFASAKTDAPPSRLSSAFLDALQHPSQSIDFTTAQAVQTQLQQAGFRQISITSVPPQDHLPWNMDWTMMDARK